MKRLLVANRGEIAVRVIRACRAQGVETVAVHSAPDAGAMHVALADVAVDLGGSTAAESYLDQGKVLAAAQSSGADAIHPGYGFLSENAGFAAAVLDAGLIWVGPPPSAIEAMGDKVSARAVATAAGVAGVPGSAGAVQDAETIIAFAADHGWPLVIKASAGGGGRGMRVVRGPDEVQDALDAARREALASFGDDTVYVERYLEWPRHVEVQVLADSAGTVIALGERDCSVQRRHQKLVEEAPAPALSDALRAGLAQAATAVAREVGYLGAGTMEFLVDGDAFFFLEMNTRLQVEHPVTEAVFGADLVFEQLRIADGHPISERLVDARPRGHAIECRINAEDPAGGRFLPSPGRITRLDLPSGPGVRFDGGYRAGDEVSQFYDNLVGKLIVWGTDREAARHATLRALEELRVEGVATTTQAAKIILAHPDFVACQHATPWLEQRVEMPEARAVAPVADDDTLQEREVWVNDRRYVLEPPLSATAPLAVARTVATPGGGGRREPRAARKARASDGTVLAPMQGTVIKVVHADGDTVSRGDVVCVLEAMKMENELTAPHDGVISGLTVQPGQGVSAGEVLFTVGSDGGDA